jgi:hypothetical protein
MRRRKTDKNGQSSANDKQFWSNCIDLGSMCSTNAQVKQRHGVINTKTEPYRDAKPCTEENTGCFASVQRNVVNDRT